jgi:CRP-like cAMP-binding protein
MVALGVRNEFDKMSSLKKGLHPISALPADDMLVRRLGNFARLTVEEQALLRKVARERVRTLGPRADLIHEGEAPQAVYLVLSGWACRHKVLEDGRRQIVAFRPQRSQQLRASHDGPFDRRDHRSGFRRDCA